MRWLLDEMLPGALRRGLERLGHATLTAREAGLAGRPDLEILEWAIREDRILVTKNVADFARGLTERLGAGEPAGPIVCVARRRGGPSGWGHLARMLDGWSRANPDPYTGPHRPTTE